MNDDFTSAPAPTPTPQPAASEPQGTPPAGGSWTWSGDWVRNDAVEQTLHDDAQPSQE